MNISAETKLWFAVLQQAILDYQKDPLTSKRSEGQKRILRIKNSAEHWLFNSELSGVGSLEWICFNFGLSKEYIRIIANGRRE